MIAGMNPQPDDPRLASAADAPVTVCNEEIFLKHQETSLHDKPISVFLNIGKENLSGLALELFEHTSSIPCAVSLLLGVMGGMFDLDRIVVCSYDAGFGANQAVSQWSSEGTRKYHGNIENVSSKDFSVFADSLDGDGVLAYGSADVEEAGEGLRRLLCLIPGESFSAYCCVTVENNAHTGRILYVSGDAKRVWDDGDKHILYDVTKIIAAHMSIENANSASRAKSEFLSRISHEIRTPMNAILGMTNIAMDSVGNPERLTDSLQKIDFSAKHLLSLINDVLEMSRIESGKLLLEQSPFSLDDFLQGMDTLMRMPLENKGKKITGTPGSPATSTGSGRCW